MLLAGALRSMVSQALSSMPAPAQRGSSPRWNRHGPPSNGEAARTSAGSARPPMAMTAVVPISASRLAMTIQIASLRRSVPDAPRAVADSLDAVALPICTLRIDSTAGYCLN